MFATASNISRKPLNTKSNKFGVVGFYYNLKNFIYPLPKYFNMYCTVIINTKFIYKYTVFKIKTTEMLNQFIFNFSTYSVID